MSIPAPVRRSPRVSSRPANYAQEQESDVVHELERAQQRCEAMEAKQMDVADDSDEEAIHDGEGSESEGEEDEKENASPNSQWVPETHDFRVPFFSHPSGSCLPPHRVRSELGYVQCFINDELVATIAANTNLYAASKGAPAGWATSVAEIWRYIAVHIFMGIVDLPQMHMYWEADYRQQYVVTAFTRRRFDDLLRYFHIAKPTPTGVAHTAIDKIEPLHTRCLQTFRDYLLPRRELTVDETMVRFKGRSTWKTVIKGKPTPIGYKLYTLASHGYLLRFQVYRGKGGYSTRQAVIHHTVIELVEHWKEKNHILFTDNLYTSPALCDYLERIGILSCGTARSTRSDQPSDLKKTMEAMKKGETKAWQKGHLGCLLWFDKRPVLFLSTHHRVDHMITFEQERGPNHPSTVTKPKIALDYNLHKGHVDTADQLRQYYAMQRKTYKNWHSLAWWLLDMCIVNAYTLWCLDTKADITQLDFRRTLLHQLRNAYPPPPHRAHPTVPPSFIPVNDGHWPQHSDKRRDCVHCSKGRESRMFTYNTCKRCGVHLCLEPCMERWHAEQS
jgi:hypothetical protein